MPDMQVPGVQHFDQSPLSANEFTLHSDPDRFVLDFKTITPQFSPGGAEPMMSITHRVVLCDPYLAKQLAGFLNKQVKEYEGRFGAIKRTAASLKAEKLAKSQTASTVEKPHYMG